ncbi:MAG: Txe/YoeB family addiction module toxin [Bacteroidales bacterium]|nr:Txe/YoeB family addiction module toxin [Bacteroidales bacterium]
MSYNLEFSVQADKQIKQWRKTNPAIYKKITSFFKELEAHPRSGTGHPEPLKGGDGITWSRKITKGDRLVYEIYDDMVFVMVISAKGHYGDK